MVVALFTASGIGAPCYRYVEIPLLHLGRRPRAEVPVPVMKRGSSEEPESAGAPAVPIGGRDCDGERCALTVR
jgi:hypothetical protein